MRACFETTAGNLKKERERRYAACVEKSGCHLVNEHQYKCIQKSSRTPTFVASKRDGGLMGVVSIMLQLDIVAK